MINLVLSILLILGSVDENESLDSYLNEKLSSFKKFEYEIVSLPKYIESINDERLIISGDRKFKFNYGFAYAPVDIKLSNEKTINSFLTLKIHLYDDVLVALRKIRRGETLSKSDFIIEEREITHLRNKAVQDWDKLGFFRASTNIGEEAILQKNMVETLPDIRIGEKVFAYSTVGSVTVSFPVLVREDGRVGEKIRVVRDDKLVFKAIVIDSKKVKIIE